MYQITIPHVFLSADYNAVEVKGAVGVNVEIDFLLFLIAESGSLTRNHGHFV